MEEESESETSIPPVHPLFIQEAQCDVEALPLPQQGSECTRNSSKGGEDLFYSVSERSVSLEYGLLASISEEGGSDVFLSDFPPPPPPVDNDSLPSLTDIKCSSSVLISSDSDGCGSTNEVMIKVLPHVVSVGDNSFKYDHNSVSSSEGGGSAADINDDDQMPPDTNPHDDEYSKEDPPILSSTPCRILSRPNSRLSSAPSRTGGYPEGTYLGTIRHKDSTLMSVVFEVLCMY